MMGMFRFITFLYDGFRFFPLFFLLARARLDGYGYFVSGLPYAAPHALFPLMAFFLWLDNKKYRPFAWLYASGKIISVCACTVSVVSEFDGFITAFLLADAKTIFINLFIPFLTLADLIFLIPVLVSFKNEISMENEG